ncbi:MAG: hypothetical protein P4K80_01735 [Acidobacteriaceae bacterium]|nr:hypothetical protein [Acidobacteriaceae bacterium]
MTRLELLHILIAQARSNGFEFRKWYTSRLGLPWEGTRQSVETLCEQRRYYALLFSHEFASNFWKAGEQITFQIPSQTFTRCKPDGSIATVTRKGYTRRSARNDVWLYHLRELAASEDPLRVMRKYLRVEDDLDPDQPAASRAKTSPPAAKKPVSPGLALVRKSQRHASSQPRPQA